MRAHTRVLTRAALVPMLVGALVASALLATGPAQAQKIKPNYWGMHDANWTTKPPVRVGAANFTTSATYWRYVETSKKEYNWTRLDQQVRAAEELGAQPMIVLGLTPKFYSPRPQATDSAGNPTFEDYMPPKRAWRRWVKKVAQRYGKRLDYQIWPEPNIIQNWQGSTRQMAKLTAIASKAIHRQSRKATVVAPAVAVRLEGQRQWMRSYFKKSVGGKRVHQYVDAIAIDPFPPQSGTPEDAYRLMRLVKRQLRRIGVRKPVWNNEINYGVAGGGQNTTTSYSVNKQQAYVIRTYALSAAAKMKRTYWLGWFKTDTMAVSMTDSAGRTAQPGEAYALVRSWLNKTRFRGCKDMKRGRWMCTAKKRGHVRRIYWDTSGRSKVRLPRSTQWVQNQEGVKDRRPGRRIRVNYRPVMVKSRR